MLLPHVAEQSCVKTEETEKILADSCYKGKLIIQIKAHLTTTILKLIHLDVTSNFPKHAQKRLRRVGLG